MTGYDIPAETLIFLTVLLHHHRQGHDVRPYQQAGNARTQAKLVLRWFRDATGVAALGADHGLSRTTAYRYHTRASTCWPPRPLHLHPILAQPSPGPGPAQAQAQPRPSPGPAQAQADGLAYLTLDGTLVPADRLAERTEAGNHAWY